MRSVLCGVFLPFASAFQGAWLPLASKAALGHRGPDAEVSQDPWRVEVAGDEYVLWKAAQQPWSVLTDTCSHRLAPLSEGRVDPETNCIECPYHGWQFGPSGACTRIPQAPDTKTAERAPGARSFPTTVTGDLVWGFLPIAPPEEGQDPWKALPPQEELQRLAAEAESHPDRLSDRFQTAENAYVRDLPYSWDFLVENFMDPSHVPFAHHGMQGMRSDGSPIPMELVRSSENALEITFQDRIRNQTRFGRASFGFPCYYAYEDRPTEDEPWRKGLTLLCVPVSPGVSRLFIPVFEDSSPFLKKFPRWISHIMSQRFIDTDAWLQDCERRAAAGYSYHTPTTSDIGPSQFRLFWRKHLEDKPLFGSNAEAFVRKGLPKQPKETYLSPHATHVKGCVPCQKALRRAKKVSQASVLLAALPVVLGLDLPVRIAGLLGFLATRHASGKVVDKLGT